MTTCKKCGKTSEDIAKVLSLCAECIRCADDECLLEIKEVHARSREKFGLPASPPCDPEGSQCRLCQNSCQIPIGGRGFCGVRLLSKLHLQPEHRTVDPKVEGSSLFGISGDGTPCCRIILRTAWVALAHIDYKGAW